jgi:hypothetical protein
MEALLAAIARSKRYDSVETASDIINGRPVQLEVSDREKTVKVSSRCTVLDINYSVTVPVDGFMQWRRGDLIQRGLSRECREFLISGCSPEGFEILFANTD